MKSFARTIAGVAVLGAATCFGHAGDAIAQPTGEGPPRVKAPLPAATTRWTSALAAPAS